MRTFLRFIRGLTTYPRVRPQAYADAELVPNQVTMNGIGITINGAPMTITP